MELPGIKFSQKKVHYSQKGCLPFNLFSSLFKNSGMHLYDCLIRFRKCSIIPHILFWLISISVFVVVLFYTRDFRISQIDLKTAVSFLVTICLLAVSVYISLLWLIPVYFRNRRYGLFILLEAANVLLFIVLNYFISVSFEEDIHLNLTTEIVAEMILVSVFLLVSALLQFTRDSLALRDIELKVNGIERQKMEAELRALKAQINPHFLFNTLNSLYSLSLDKSDRTPELILKLSDLMRYVIYESSVDYLPLERQLDFIKSYIYLEELRAGPSLEVDFRITGDSREIMIAPLLFIPFVENAFKHVTRDFGRKPDILVSFDLTNPGRVVFLTRNNVESKPAIRREGIGLTNARKSLNILYPENHRLEISEADNLFQVNLIIELV